MKTYLKYLSLLVVVLVFYAGQLVYLAIRGPAPTFALTAVGPAGLADFLADMVQRAGFASDADAGTWAPLLVHDRAFQPLPAGTLPAGPFDASLDPVQRAGIAGSHVVLGFNSLAGTENPRNAAELAAWSGIDPIGWVGAFVEDLATADVQESTRLAWEKQHARNWSFTGPGIVLQSTIDDRVVVLRRGRELARDFFSVRGDAAGIVLDSLFAGRFVVPTPDLVLSAIPLTAPVPVVRAAEHARAFLGLSPGGAAVLAAAGIPADFPVLTSRPYGTGRVWTIGIDLLQPDEQRLRFSLVPFVNANAARSLNEPTDPAARTARLTVPMMRAVGLAATAPTAAPAVTRFRAGERYLERRTGDGPWEPWFVKGVNIGPATPGHWFGDPPTEERIYADWFTTIAATGFDSIRVYTLLPPAFYRALVAWNLSAEQPLYLIQEIWPEEVVPYHDLGDPGYLAAYFAESDRTIDALFGRADIAERPYRAWGSYRADVGPWLAAVLVGRELEPEEVLATAHARPNERFVGRYFVVEPGHPAESVLARMAERAAERLAFHAAQPIPIGFVSWPILDVLQHLAEWSVDADGPPFNDRAEFDVRAILPGPDNVAGRFAAYHVYPNYPDFMIRSRGYEIPGDEFGLLRYEAYLKDLLNVTEGVPLLIAEFGLATGYATAHIHPEGLDHGGLTAEAQAAGVIAMFESLAAVGTTGGIVFQWADEWAKKTWTTEPFMIPYDRNPIWFNAIDPEQNYGVMYWDAAATAQQLSADAQVQVWQDPAFLQITLAADVVAGRMLDEVASAAAADPAGSAATAPGGALVPDGRLDLGIDVVPGESGEFRLYPGGPRAPFGAEFMVRARFESGRLVSAQLLVNSGYNRGTGRLFPTYSQTGEFQRILTLVNGEKRNLEGRYFAPLYEDGSTLRLGADGLAELHNDGSLTLRLPWSRLNFADPSSRLVLLDPRPDVLAVVATDTFQTLEIADLQLWAIRSGAPTGPAYWPAADAAFRVPLLGWDVVYATLRPKPVQQALAAFLPGWRPLDRPAAARAAAAAAVAVNRP